MFRRSRKHTILWAALAFVSLASAPSRADPQADGDTQEINRYVLTEAGLAKYTQAAKNMGVLATQMAGNCDEIDGEDMESLSGLAAYLDSVPGAPAAISSAGMTTREYTVFTFSLVQNGVAAWALDQPGGKLPPGMSMANVNFYRAHAAAIQKLSKETPSPDCDDGNDEGDSED